MRVRVKFFAILRERAGKGEALEEIADGSTVAGLRFLLISWITPSTLSVRSFIGTTRSDFVR